MTAYHIGNSTVIHPVVVVTINGFKFRALLDSGASHLYASATAIDWFETNNNADWRHNKNYASFWSGYQLSYW